MEAFMKTFARKKCKKMVGWKSFQQEEAFGSYFSTCAHDFDGSRIDLRDLFPSPFSFGRHSYF